jgi:hypothetical protein
MWPCHDSAAMVKVDVFRAQKKSTVGAYSIPSMSMVLSDFNVLPCSTLWQDNIAI